VLPAIATTIWKRRFFERGAPPQSDLRPTAPWLNDLLYRVTACEARWVGGERLRLPAGASIVCRAVRT
jgi:hypothetical protein